MGAASAFPEVCRPWRVKTRELDADPAFRRLAIDTGAVQNIAGGGIAFESDRRHPTGAMLAVEIASPGSRTSIIALARVADARPRNSRFLVQAEIWWLAWNQGDHQQRLAEVVTDALGISVTADLAGSLASG